MLRKQRQKIRNNHSKRQEIRNEQEEHFLACEALKKELPNPLDPNAWAVPITDDNKEKLKEFKLHLRKILECQEKVRILKQEADAILNKSENTITKEVTHGYNVMHKTLGVFDK